MYCGTGTDNNADHSATNDATGTSDTANAYFSDDYTCVTTAGAGLQARRVDQFAVYAANRKSERRYTHPWATKNERKRDDAG